MEGDCTADDGKGIELAGELDMDAVKSHGEDTLSREDLVETRSNKLNTSNRCCSGLRETYGFLDDAQGAVCPLACVRCVRSRMPRLTKQRFGKIRLLPRAPQPNML